MQWIICNSILCEINFWWFKRHQVKDSVSVYIDIDRDRDSDRDRDKKNIEKFLNFFGIINIDRDIVRVRNRDAT